MSDVLLHVEHLVKEFPIRKGLFRRQVGTVHAVSDISFEVTQGTTFGLVGESGSGKTTTARCLLRLEQATDGSVFLGTQDITRAQGKRLKAMRRRMQLVFQDPYASLNPRMTIHDIVADPLRVQHKYQSGNSTRVHELLELVGLRPEHASRYPHEFSGGQRQRVGIARALALNPDLLVLDEPVSALDVSIQAGIVNLLDDLQDELGLTYVLVAHDLSVVRHISDQVGVMYLGKIMELGDADDIYDSPQHPYTVALLSAVPIPDPQKERARERIVLQGDMPSAADPPSGCRFRTRCWKAQQICADEEPELIQRGGNQLVACHFPE